MYLNWIAFCTLTKKEISRFLRIWTQTLLPSPVSIMLYFLIFGELIGPRIGKMEGYHYIEYIAPGLIMMAVINNSFSNVVASFYSAKFQKNIEEMLVAPMSSWMIILGFTIGGVIRGCLIGLIVTVVALFFTHLSVQHMGIVILVILATTVLFSLAGLINAIFSKKFDDINIIPVFVLTPLTYLGGVFYSIKMLPAFWQKVAYFNPILYIINAFRYSMLGVADVSVNASLISLVGFNLLLFFIAWQLIERGVGLKA